MSAQTEPRTRRSLLVGAVYVFALGQILSVTLASGLGRGPFHALQLALFGLLGAAAVRGVSSRTRTLGVYGLAVVGLVGALAGVRDLTGDLWAAVLALGALTALVSYGLHRYELVLLDLVEGDA
jgi:membrane associated rhomboid family serine protease